MPPEIKRALEQAAQQDAQGPLPVVLETRHLMASYGFAIDGEGNPILAFDVPHMPGIERKMFPFSWEAFGRYITALQKFQEEHGPKG